MKAYGSTTTTVKTSRWEAMVILVILLFTSQVVSGEQAVVVQGPGNLTAAAGDPVALTCVFNQSVDCSWWRSGQSYAIQSQDGRTYSGGSGMGTTNCTILISAVTEADFTKWHCSQGSSAPVISTQGVGWITKQVTPSAPVIMFKKQKVTELKVPSSDPAIDNLVCMSERGNPPPKLMWDVNGTEYAGIVDKTEVGLNLYTVKLIWQRGVGWETFDNFNEVTCTANHRGFTTTMAAKLQFKRNYAPTIVKVYADGSNEREVAVECGDKVTIACVSDGQPTPTSYTWELWSEQNQTWRLHSSNEQNISVSFELAGKYRCKASNELNRDTPKTSTNEFTVSKSNESAMKLQRNKRDFGITAGVLVTVLIITVIGFTLVVIKLRGKLKSRIAASPAPLPTLGQLNPAVSPSSSNPSARDGNVYKVEHAPANKFSRPHPSTSSHSTIYHEDDPDEVEYCNVSRANVDSCVYLDPMEVYEEITERPVALSRPPRQLKGVDAGYIVLH